MENTTITSKGTSIFWPVCSVKIIDPVFERDDPAVEEVARSDLLAAEIVDQQNSSVGFHLERSLVDTSGRR